MLYEFSEFRLDPAQRTLMRNGEQMPLTPKVFDTLLFLVQNSGRTLEKDELMKALWPESFVEEGNLSQNVFLLRKTLGDDQNGHCFIQTIPRRGYKFVAPVKLLEIPRHPAQSSLSAEYWSQHSPFRGLQVFEPDDAWLFFGRDSETEELLFRLGQSPILMVIGNSGCGKSSLIRAGLIPALRKGRFPRGDEPAPSWRVAIVRPTGAPFDYLAEVLPGQLAPELSVAEQTEFIADCRKKLPLGGEGLRDAICALTNAAAPKSSQCHVLLVVDQFEELFTLTTNSEVRASYIESLLAASRWNSCAPVHLLLVLRADFYSHCLEYPALSHCLETNLYNVPRMQYDQLREAIERRLALAGAQAESGLIDSLLDDVGTEPGNLALLEHTLSHLWEKCGGFGRTLTNETYSTIGRLRGALSAHADAVYGEIADEAEKRLVQKTFLELVQLGEGAPDTRRRVRKKELFSLGAPEQVESLLARLSSSRLISISSEGQNSFVEVSHEALIREWSTLREWISQNREELRLERRLSQAAEEWERLNRDAGALLQGARLTQGEEWLVRHPDASALSREFIGASVAASEESEERELRKQKTAAIRLRWLSAGLVGLLLIALGSENDSAVRLIGKMLAALDGKILWEPIYWFSLPALAIIWFILARRKLARELPFFFYYIVSSEITGLTRLAVYYLRPNAYGYAYWTSEFLLTLLALLTTCELFLKRFSPTFHETRFCRRFIPIAAYFSFLIAFIAFLGEQINQHHFLASLHALHLVSAVILMFFVGLMLLMRHHWTRNEFAIASGLTFDAAGTLIAFAVWMEKSRPSQLPVLAYDLACMVWLISFLRPK